MGGKTLYVRTAIATILAVTSFAASPKAIAATTITFGSDTTWDVYNGNPSSGTSQLLGKAEFVAANASSPTVQPPGTVNYGYPAAGGLTANLSSIPGSFWVWAPGITGSTIAPDFQQYYFSKTMQLGTPLSGSISVAADDLVEVIVNGTSVGSYGSITTPLLATQSTLKTYDLLPFLVSGNNTITIRGENGPSSFSVFATPGQPATYAQNPAAVVFGGAITAIPLPAGFSAGLITLLGLAIAYKVKGGSRIMAH